MVVQTQFLSSMWFDFYLITKIFSLDSIRRFFQNFLVFLGNGTDYKYFCGCSTNFLWLLHTTLCGCSIKFLWFFHQLSEDVPQSLLTASNTSPHSFKSRSSSLPYLTTRHGQTVGVEKFIVTISHDKARSNRWCREVYRFHISR